VATSLPPQSPDAQQHPANVYAERMARADGCPRCLTNYEPPRAVIPHDGGFTAGYLCESCGNFWLTNWSER